MRKRAAISFFSTAIILCSLPAMALAQEGLTERRLKTVWDGVYTAEQAERGKTAYQAECTGCHGPDLLGGVPGTGSSGGGNAPMLMGERFMDRWREDDLVELFTLIRSGMPRQRAQSVSDATKIDILAYIFERNSFPAGKAELNLDGMESVYLVGKDGPKPLPSTTPVRTVGCLTKGAGNAWMLSSATEAFRTRRVDETNEQELKAAAAMPLGSLSFRLPSLDYAIPGVRPAPLQGHKVQIKGIVYRQVNDNTISVRSMKSLASTCGS